MNNQQQPADSTWIVVIALIALVFLRGGGIGVASSPTKTLPDVPSVFVLYDSDPFATKEMNSSRNGVSDVITSIADDSAKVMVTKGAKGVWITYGTKEPAPEETKAGKWPVEAYLLAKAGGKLPWMVVSTPTGKGFSGPVPDTGNDWKAAQDQTKKILEPLLK